MLEYFYHQSIRKIVVAFGTLFNKVYIARYDDAGAEIERMKVPIGYGPQQKFLRRLQRIGTDFNQTQVKIENYIPRISFEMQSVVYDPTRKLNTLNQTIRYNNPTSLTTRYERVPYNIDFTLGVVTKNTEDALQIMEQILPYFQPEYTVTIKMNDMDPAVDIPFVIKTCTMGDGEDGSYGNYDMRKLTYMTFTFTAKVIIVSTPKGMNMFYKIWKDALGGRNPYKAVEVKWWEVPGRDDAWKETTKKALGSDRLWAAEYECEFLGSEDTLIRTNKLSTLVYETPKFQTTEGLSVYEDVKPEGIYIMCVDTSRALGLDYHALTVIDATQVPNRVVACFRSNTMPLIMLPNIICSIGNRYNEAQILIEINDSGQQVADIIHDDIEYENIIIASVRGKKGQKISTGGGGGRAQYGIRMSNQIKKTGCLMVKELVENDKLILNDFNIVSELSTYIQSKTSWAASEGYNDDLVSTLVLYGWLTTQPYYKDLVNSDLRRKLISEKLKKIEEDMTPFGFLSSESDSDADSIELSRENPRQKNKEDQNTEGTWGW